MRVLLLLALGGCIDQPADTTSSSVCGAEPATHALYPDVTTVADDTVTMSVEAWNDFHTAAREIGDYMQCRELARCGDLPEFPPDVQNPVELCGNVTVTYRDWQRRLAWRRLAELWLECAE